MDNTITLTDSRPSVMPSPTRLVPPLDNHNLNINNSELRMAEQVVPLGLGARTIGPLLPQLLREMLPKITTTVSSRIGKSGKRMLRMLKLLSLRPKERAERRQLETITSGR